MLYLSSSSSSSFVGSLLCSCDCGNHFTDFSCLVLLYAFVISQLDNRTLTQTYTILYTFQQPINLLSRPSVFECYEQSPTRNTQITSDLADGGIQITGIPYSGTVLPSEYLDRNLRLDWLWKFIHHNLGTPCVTYKLPGVFLESTWHSVFFWEMLEGHVWNLAPEDL